MSTRDRTELKDSVVVNAGSEPPTADELQALVDEVVSIRAALPKDFRPVVVEFAGSPKSGKTTTIDIVSHFFKRLDFSVYAPSEGASKRSP